MNEASARLPGTVHLVGAGPGDPGLLTLRGMECLQRADVVLYDYLANPAILEHAPDAAERIPLGRPHTGRSFTPEEICALMIEEARHGRTVVRLKGGDPSVFGRGADETEALREAGIPYDIVPGITAGLAVGSYCEIPVTQHCDASAVALVTGRERNAKGESCLDFAALAAFPGTLVFYMGVGRAAEWSAALMACGKPADTPVGIVRWCTRADQRLVRCTLATVVRTIQQEDVRPPSIVVVGDVVARAPERSWFAARPLFGTRVLIPDPAPVAAPLRDELAALGAEILVRPVLAMADPPEWQSLDAALDAVDAYDWLVFSSANAVDPLMRRLFARGTDVRALGRARLAALGPGTAERLARYHLRSDLLPSALLAASGVSALLDSAAGRKVMLVREGRERDVVGAALEGAGALVAPVVACYQQDVVEPDAEVAERLAEGEIGWVAVTSEGAARSVVRLYGEALRTVRFATLDPTVSDVLRSLGWEPEVEAFPHTSSALVEAILERQATPGAATLGGAAAPVAAHPSPPSGATLLGPAPGSAGTWPLSNGGSSRRPG